ncbi:hypothetical protein BABINDRAFT_161386 [Babjeviella inositovora NRRL Y-12698]|uniref:Uncharacterized protein n=1 Tax=Babjeviella inositovora NRRL Y-12698 TaxID=984486 RepID=A0A1E3QS08_9ASCO|nr:uncharacterized protein BABINDRAFT_161386 [Babjeviella inositovora NRRL Y-12698]ODQ80450.1 hypothetical protein BABINDRAFT_161386 [Babjeviella inositovora NRRL Y-12698]
MSTDIDMTGSPTANASFGSPPRQGETPSKPPTAHQFAFERARTRTVYPSFTSPIRQQFDFEAGQPEQLDDDFSKFIQGKYSRKLSTKVLDELNDRAADKLISSSLKLSPVRSNVRGNYLANKRASRLNANTGRRKSSHRYSLTHVSGFSKMESIDSHYSAARAPHSEAPMCDDPNARGKNTRVYATPARTEIVMDIDPIETSSDKRDSSMRIESVTKRRRTLLGSQEVTPKGPHAEHSSDSFVSTPKVGEVRHTGMSGELQKVLTLKNSPLHATNKERKPVRLPEVLRQQQRQHETMRQTNSRLGFRSRIRPQAPAKLHTNFASFSSSSFLAKITRSTTSSSLKAAPTTDVTISHSRADLSSSPPRRPEERLLNAKKSYGTLNKTGIPRSTSTASITRPLPIAKSVTAHTQALAVKQMEKPKIFPRSRPEEASGVPRSQAAPFGVLPRSQTTHFGSQLPRSTSTRSISDPVPRSTDLVSRSIESASIKRPLRSSRSIADLKAPLAGTDRLRKMQSMRDIGSAAVRPAWR